MEQSIQRVRLKLGNLELEVEGAAAFEEFHRLRENGFGGLISAATPLPFAASSTIDLQLPEQPPDLSQLPSLSDLAVRGVGGSEREWAVIYGLYLTARDNKKTFATADVWGLYKESGRDNRSRQANLHVTLKRCVKAEWLTKIKDDTFALTPGGKTKALEIMSRTAPAKKRQPKAKGKN